MAKAPTILDVKSLLPVKAWPKLIHTLKKDWPKYYVELTGRASVKSIGNCHLLIFALLCRLWDDTVDYGYDALIMVYELVSVSNTTMSDFEKSFSYGGWPEDMFFFERGESKKKYIRINWGTKHCKIWFCHGAGGKYLNLKGYRPSGKNKWYTLLFYEFDNFTNWTAGDVEMCLGTLARDSDPEVFHVSVEMNQPIMGSPSMWILDWIEAKRKEEEKRKQALAVFPDNPDLQQKVIEFTQYSVFDFKTKPAEGLPWKSEFHHFTNSLQRSIMTTLAMADRDMFNWVYRGMPIAAEGGIFSSQLHQEEHFGLHKDFNPTVLVIGVDFGMMDANAATMSGYEFPNELNGGQLRIQTGICCAWHSNRWKECRVPSDKMGVMLKMNQWKKKETWEWVREDLVQFIEQCMKFYPHRVIEVYLEYADTECRDYAAYLQEVFDYTPYLHFGLDWYKGEIKNRILFDKLAITRKGCYKCASKEIWEAKLSLKMKDAHEDDEGKFGIEDKTSKREYKFYDLNDADWYTRPDHIRLRLLQHLLAAHLETDEFGRSDNF